MVANRLAKRRRGVANKAMANRQAGLAGVEGLEPPTPGFGDRCSSQLSYTPRRGLNAPWRKRAQALKPRREQGCSDCARKTPLARKACGPATDYELCQT